MELDYRLITKGPFTVISFKGKFSKESKERIEVCQQEILQTTSQFVVLFFRDVHAIEIGILRELTQFQQELRKGNMKIFITGLSTSLKELLDSKGVIRSNETKNSLEEILLQTV